MARGDVRYDRSNRGGWGSSNNYDDEGRGRSKALYERFAEDFERTGFSKKWLLGLDPKDVYKFHDGMTYRHNLHDFAESATHYDDGDGRVRRLVEKHCGKKAWAEFLGLLRLGKEQLADEKWLEQIARQILRRKQSVQEELDRQAREAERLQRVEEQTLSLRNEAQLTSGLLHSDLYEAFEMKERYGEPEGDELDDPLEAYQTGYGWLEEYRERSSIKLQVTLSLDISNSMYYNRVYQQAIQAFRELHMALGILKNEFPTSFFTSSFIFSGDREGKQAYRLRSDDWRATWDAYKGIPQENWLGEMEQFRNVSSSFFDGEDTWIYTLFEELEKWENSESDPGAVRLDLVISDAVLEHPYDIRWSDAIQDRRDGALQTVILNLMPEGEWHNGALPRRCVQYPAQANNLAGQLRLIIGEFVSVYL